MEEHPDEFEQAVRYEKNALEHGSPFMWSQGESLVELAKPERVAEIRVEHERRVERLRSRMQVNPLRSGPEMMDVDDVYGQAKVCLACHK